MAGAEQRSMDSPDETRTPDKTKVDVVKINDASVARAVFQPGWRWSECVAPVVGTDSCQKEHFGVITSGRLGIRHEDGTEMEMSPGNVYHVMPGHEAWVVGDEPAVTWEFESDSAATYAKG